MKLKMFSPQALAHFKAFATQDAADRAHATRSSNPEGAFDATGRELKAALARETSPWMQQVMARRSTPRPCALS